MKGGVKLKKETYKAWVDCWTSEVADSYWQAKRSMAWVVIEAKTQLWEKFDEAM